MTSSFIIYLLFINTVAFFAMLIDKRRAINKQWRISEKALIGMSVAGGSIGMLCGMQIFRHKTKHKKFTIGIPLILVVQILLLGFSLENYEIILKEINKMF
ncbi:MAG: DUF1294 domain-containing protein [Clostridium sp.]|nr:DUF1294 domain-containing protein [Clostridium sp.]MDU7082314.1 DUF1294 domain-containing protein [Clostridium sp.]